MGATTSAMGLVIAFTVVTQPLEAAMTVDEPRRLLLLTATVTPHPRMGALAVTDADERYEQYCDAFRFLVSSGASSRFDAIVLCENSGFPLERFDEAFSGSAAEVIYVPVEMDASAGEFGRGYSEMLLIDRALERVGAAIGETDRVWKLTGRYRVGNLRTVVEKTDPFADLVVTLRRFPSKWADLYLFAFNRHGWRAIAEHLDDLKAASGSVVMYDVIDGMAKDEATALYRLGAEPRLMGVRGHDQQNYDSVKQRFKRQARRFLHAIAPGLRV